MAKIICSNCNKETSTEAYNGVYCMRCNGKKIKTKESEFCIKSEKGESFIMFFESSASARHFVINHLDLSEKWCITKKEF